MRSLLLLHTCFALIVAALSGGCSQDAAQDEPSIVWRTDLDVGKFIANRDNKPLVLVYTGSTWCPPCQMMERETWPSSSLAAFAEQVVWVKYDAPSRASADMTDAQSRAFSAMQQAGIRAVPTIYVLAPSGKVAVKLEGFQPAQRIVDEINKVIARI